MKVTEKVEVEAVTDVVCDVCLTSTHVAGGGLEFATVKAHWGYGSQNDGERYELHLCESCFFGTLGYFKQERRVQNLFSEDGCPGDLNAGDELGLVAKDDYFHDQGSS
ncbi:hypothetical protein QC823_07600 [Halomonas vilamensis]|uniref:Small CPxCG-related zinc finger protein n=1 Tax=Vreelandella vilamensis TaxID=531309 RepID=A0ABU1H4T6_9GAMM|nr:hypothetical protein [Halomonas vilamensis]MDR5898851.1 hypothetical protein [Halomonas vilamensis]